MTIEVFFWEGCPSTAEAEALLDEVLLSHGLDATVEWREVRTQEEAEALRFVGSPTIRVDGRDVDPYGAEHGRPSLTCRVYSLPTGVSPVPSREQIERALGVAA